MRILVVGPGPAFSVEDVKNGWVKGLRQNGCQVADFNLGARMSFFGEHRQYEPKWDCYIRPYDDDDSVMLAIDGLFSEVFKGWPDVVIIVSGFFVPVLALPLLRERGMKVVYLFTESPYQDDQQTAAAGFADLTIINDPVNLGQYPSGTYYQPHSYDPDIHHPRRNGPPKWDFGFVGTGFESRRRFFEQVNWDDLEVTIEGMWRPEDIAGSPIRRYLPDDPTVCLDNDQTADLYRACKTSANFYRREANDNATADGVACGPREIELAACGTFFIRDPRPESDELFPMLPTFGSPAEFGDLLRWWTAHDTARERAACKARSAIADRTFEQAAARLLTHLDNT